MEDRYAQALAAAICADLVGNPPAGALSRVVIRWFEGPLYLTIHALGTDEEEDLEDYDAWSPLEWGNIDEEIDRADRIVSRPAVTAAGAALAATWRTGFGLGNRARRLGRLSRPPGCYVACASDPN